MKCTLVLAFLLATCALLAESRTKILSRSNPFAEPLTCDDNGRSYMPGETWTNFPYEGSCYSKSCHFVGPNMVSMKVNSCGKPAADGRQCHIDEDISEVYPNCCPTVTCLV